MIDDENRLNRELSAFPKDDEDLTGTFRFLATFFVVTFLAAAAFIAGLIALTAWLVNRG